MLMDAAPPAPVMEKKKKKKLKWEKGKWLGVGCSGIVTSAFLKDGPCRTPVAIKSAQGEASIQSCLREKEFLDQLRGCPQVIQCYGDKYTISRKVRTYNLVLELAPDVSLDEFLKSSRRFCPLDELSAGRYTRSILKGLVHIHSNGVVHCDLRPDNIMLWGASEVKIIDFGRALRAGEKNDLPSYRTAETYLAPECIAKNEYRTAADVWALGCTVYTMLTCKLAICIPYSPTFKEKFKEFLVLAGEGKIVPEMPEAMSETSKDFLSNCFQVDPMKRWTAEMLLKHPFVAELDDNNDDDRSSVAKVDQKEVANLHDHETESSVGG